MVEQANWDSELFKPMPDEVARLEYVAEFTPKEFELISRGYWPGNVMDDKWFIFLQGTTLNFHRSATGHCIFQVEFVPNGENYSVRRATANRQLDQYNQVDDAFDVKLLDFLIKNFLLGRNEPFPIPSDLSKGLPKGLYQHHIAGTGFPERRVERKPWWKWWK